MKKLKIVFAALCLSLFAFVFTACGEDVSTLEGFVSAMESSSGDCETVQADLEVKDGETVVYGYTRRLERGNDVFNVTETEKKLNDSFELKESTTTSQTKISDDAAVLPVSLSEQNLTQYQIEDGVLSATVDSADAMNTVLKTDKFAMEGSASVTCKLNKKKIEEILISYHTTGGRLVSVSVRYTY